MKRVLSVAVFVASATCVPASAADRFQQKLPADKQISHVISRLTFGQRPGDAAAVRQRRV